MATVMAMTKLLLILLLMLSRMRVSTRMMTIGVVIMILGL